MDGVGGGPYWLWCESRVPIGPWLGACAWAGRSSPSSVGGRDRRGRSNTGAAEGPDWVWTGGVPASCALALAPVLTEAAAECGWPPMILRVTTAASNAASCSTARLDIAITTPARSVT